MYLTAFQILLPDETHCFTCTGKRKYSMVIYMYIKLTFSINDHKKLLTHVYASHQIACYIRGQRALWNQFQNSNPYIS